MTIPTIRSIGAETKFVHIALLDVLVGVLVNTVLLAALSVLPEEAAHRHPVLVVLVEEAASIALHTKATQPVAAHRLPEAPPPGNVPACDGHPIGRARGRGGSRARRSGGGVRRREGTRGRHRRNGRGGDIEAALKIEVEGSFGFIHRAPASVLGADLPPCTLR